MSQYPSSLKTFCKKNKAKLPKEPYMLQSYALQKTRLEVLDFLRKKTDEGGGSVTVKIPRDNTDGCLFSENGRYYFSSDNLGKHYPTDAIIRSLLNRLGSN